MFLCECTWMNFFSINKITFQKANAFMFVEYWNCMKKKVFFLSSAEIKARDREICVVKKQSWWFRLDSILAKWNDTNYECSCACDSREKMFNILRYQDILNDTLLHLLGYSFLVAVYISSEKSHAIYSIFSLSSCCVLFFMGCDVLTRGCHKSSLKSASWFLLRKSNRHHFHKSLFFSLCYTTTSDRIFTMNNNNNNNKNMRNLKWMFISIKMTGWMKLVTIFVYEMPGKWNSHFEYQ